MNTFLEVAPVINMVTIVGGGLLVVLRVGDMLRRFEKTSDAISRTIGTIDKRLTVVETICAVNHPNHRKSMGLFEDESN